MDVDASKPTPDGKQAADAPVDGPVITVMFMTDMDSVNPGIVDKVRDFAKARNLDIDLDGTAADLARLVRYYTFDDNDIEEEDEEFIMAVRDELAKMSLDVPEYMLEQSKTYTEMVVGQEAMGQDKDMVYHCEGMLRVGKLILEYLKHHHNNECDAAYWKEKGQGSNLKLSMMMKWDEEFITRVGYHDRVRFTLMANFLDISEATKLFVKSFALQLKACNFSVEKVNKSFNPQNLPPVDKQKAAAQ